MKKYKSVIWDWNGTLLNDPWLCLKIANKILKNHNDLQLDLEAYRSVFGFPITSYYEKIGIDFQKESMQVLTEKFISSYTAEVLDCELHQGVTEILANLQKCGVKQYILTAAHKSTIIPLLTHYKIFENFVAIEGLDNHRAESKVERGHILLSSNQIEKESAIMVGDTDHDLEVAKELGIACIQVANGHQSKSRLEHASAGRIQVLDSIKSLSLLLK